MGNFISGHSAERMQDCVTKCRNPHLTKAEEEEEEEPKRRKTRMGGLGSAPLGSEFPQKHKMRDQICAMAGGCVRSLL